MEAIKTADKFFSGIYPDYMKFIKYLIVGAVGTVVDLSLFAVMVIFTFIDYSLAMALTYTVGMVINYTLNRRFTFNSKYKKVHYQFVSYAVIAIIGWAVQEAFMYVVIQLILANTTVDLYVITTRAVAIFVSFLLTYIANKTITFKVFQ